ncbi:MAG TPA: hypothetical protein VFI66_07380 [Gemmatimonadales bacterium]|nr:hypothetical protein [Gemmatimonadales bacterium]
MRAAGMVRVLACVVIAAAAPAPGAAQAAARSPRDDLWQITLKDGTIVWNLHIVKLERDALVFRQDSATLSYPLMRVDELRMVRAGEHEIGPVAAGGRYQGAANGESDLVYHLTLLDLAERRAVVERLLGGSAPSP